MSRIRYALRFTWRRLWLTIYIEQGNNIPPISDRTSYRAFDGICAVVNTWIRSQVRQSSVPFATHSRHVSAQNGNEPAGSQEILGANSSQWRDIFDLFNQRW